MAVSVSVSTTEVTVDGTLTEVSVDLVGVQGAIGPAGIDHVHAPLVYDAPSQSLDLAYGTGLTLSGGTALVPDFGTTSGKVTAGDDARLSDTRTPTDGSVTDAKITAGGLSPASIAGTAIVTTDPRLSDSRTPTGTAGGALAGTYPNPSLSAVVTAGTATKVTYNAYGQVTAGTVLAAADIPTILPAQVQGTAVITTDARLSDSRSPSGNAGGGLTGTYPNPTLGTASFGTAIAATGTAIAAGTALLAAHVDHVHTPGTGTIGTAQLRQDFSLTTGQLSQSGASTNDILHWSGTAWVPTAPTGGAAWGGITGTLSSQTDLDSALSGKIAAAIVDAKGDLIVGTAADTVGRLAVGGTNGHILTVDSTAASGMKWAAAPDAGGLVLITAATFSASTGVSVNNCFTTTYDEYVLVFEITGASVNAAYVQYRLRASGSDAAGTDYRWMSLYAYKGASSGAGTVGSYFGVDYTAFRSVYELLNTDTFDSWTMNIMFPATAVKTRFTVTEGMMDKSSAYWIADHVGTHVVAQAYDGFSLIPSSGNITGQYALYGRKRA